MNCLPVCALQKSQFPSSLAVQEQFLQKKSRSTAAQGDEAFNHHKRLPSSALSVIEVRPAGLWAEAADNHSTLLCVIQHVTDSPVFPLHSKGILIKSNSCSHEKEIFSEQHWGEFISLSWQEVKPLQSRCAHRTALDFCYQLIYIDLERTVFFTWLFWQHLLYSLHGDIVLPII